MKKNKPLINIDLDLSVFIVFSILGTILIFLFFKSGGMVTISEILPIQLTSKIEIDYEQIKYENDINKLKEVLGRDDVEFVRRENYIIDIGVPEITELQHITLRSLESTRDAYFAVDSRTMMTDNIFDVSEAVRSNFKIVENSKEPQILIFHTHANEYFVDSDPELGVLDGIVSVGAELARILQEDYGLNVIHCYEQFDFEDNKIMRTGAYERMEEPIRQILEENPSIIVALDIHRDGVDESVHLVTEYNGVNYAKIMFVNGITTLIEDGVPVPIDYLNNPFLQETLAFSLQMQLSAENQFPNLNRKILLHPYRLSTHMLPRSALVEVGAQTNTKQEAKNSMKFLAKMLTDVIL